MTPIEGNPVPDTSDLIDVDSLLSDSELELRRTVRGFVDAEIKPHIADWYDAAEFPVGIIPRLAELGLLGMHLTGYGCPGRSAVEYGIAALELEAGDSGLRTFVSVQGSLAMTAIVPPFCPLSNSVAIARSAMTVSTTPDGRCSTRTTATGHSPSRTARDRVMFTL